MGHDNRIELHDFAGQLGLTPEQVSDELAAGRLAFDIDEDGKVHTDRFAVLDWIQRRVAAVGLFGQNGISFPMYPADWADREFIPGPSLRTEEPAEAERQSVPDDEGVEHE